MILKNVSLMSDKALVGRSVMGNSCLASSLSIWIISSLNSCSSLGKHFSICLGSLYYKSGIFKGKPDEDMRSIANIKNTYPEAISEEIIAKTVC